ncbi:hypothetical protein [Stutzerimonas stutzeri]|uniref:hypothetical protein n=1 Tax=Stutzerimonas stutzeri TaxID=316 RepID=UPI003B775874
MDDYLDKSDELHVEILGLLDGVPAYPGVSHEVALVACDMALEHALSLRLFEWQLLAERGHLAHDSTTGLAASSSPEKVTIKSVIVSF